MNLKKICTRFGIGAFILILSELLLAAMFSGIGHAQQNQVQFLANGPVPVSGGNASVVGTAGLTTYYYWIVAKYPIGNSVPLGPITLNNAPNTLSGGNYVQLNWNGVVGATGYDIIKSTTNSLPNTGVFSLVLNTAATTYNDTGQSLSAYSVTSAGSVRGSIVLNAVDYAQSRFIFDQWIMVPTICFTDGTCQSTAGGGGSGNCTTTVIPYTALTAAATTMNVSLGISVAQGSTVVLSRIKEGTIFACSGGCTGISAMTVSMGRSGAVSDYSPAFALFQTVSDTNFFASGGALGTTNAANTVTATFTVTNGTPGNLGDGTTTRLTGGSVAFKACVL